MEGALADYDPVTIASLEANDPRHVLVNLAGPAALLVARVHKLGEPATCSGCSRQHP